MGGSAREVAIKRIDAALEHVRAIEPEIKGNWGAYDLERIHQICARRAATQTGRGLNSEAAMEQEQGFVLSEEMRLLR